MVVCESCGRKFRNHPDGPLFEECMDCLAENCGIDYKKLCAERAEKEVEEAIKSGVEVIIPDNVVTL